MSHFCSLVLMFGLWSKLCIVKVVYIKQGKYSVPFYVPLKPKFIPFKAKLKLYSVQKYKFGECYLISGQAVQIAEKLQSTSAELLLL